MFLGDWVHIKHNERNGFPTTKTSCKVMHVNGEESIVVNDGNDADFVINIKSIISIERADEDAINMLEHNKLVKQYARELAKVTEYIANQLYVMERNFELDHRAIWLKIQNSIDNSIIGQQ